MTEIDALKRLNDDVPPATPLALARARQRVLVPQPAARRSTGRRRMVVAGALAGTLAVGFLVNDVVTKNNGTVAPGATADAGTFLATAADQSAGALDAPIPAGQYRQVTQRIQEGWSFGPRNTYHGTRLSVTDWWVPSTQTPPFTAISVLGAKQEFSSKAAEQLWRRTDPLNVKPRKIKTTQACAVLTGGALLMQSKGATDPCKGSWMSPTADFVARLPQDPAALLAALRKNDHTWPGLGDAPAQGDYRAFERAGSILVSGFAMSEQRATLYKALRGIHGIQLLPDTVNLDGNAGRAIGLVELWGIRKELIIDSKTGQFIGLREVATVTAPLNGDGDPMPYKSGDVISWTSVATRITANRPTV
ncbi:CU044_5270 family protein [Kribbella sp.]|uniref:CU044_5270 family protein n=1 Tax=Kribbella sp. TaxID=1871183 RepID=UPI002D60B41C|nr:CU044_5270 family protein [Kribbella sp.]HZX05844.1 CU044_5270 family protein [Kribbella sp.]